MRKSEKVSPDSKLRRVLTTLHRRRKAARRRFVHLLIESSRRSATRAKARMNNYRNALIALTVDSGCPAGLMTGRKDTAAADFASANRRCAMGSTLANRR